MPDPTLLRPKQSLLFIVGIITLVLAAGIVMRSRKPDGKDMTAQPLLAYCAASLKAPMEKIAADYLRETGVPVELSFGGSQTLLANIGITRRGDLYLPADDSYIALAREKNLITNSFPFTEQTAVLAVARGNPKRIHSLAAFQNSSLTLAQANPESAAIGKLLRAATEPSGLWQVLSNRTLVFKPNVNDAANDVKLGAVDAAIAWDSMQSQYPDLELVRLPELETVKARVAVGVLLCSEQLDAAQKFASYIASPRQGLKRFEQSGFNTARFAAERARD
jgi:molybdate transport system substrate-binding protein